MKNHDYCVYIMASKGRVLYIGVTNNLLRRTSEHRQNLIDGFSKKYNCHFLVFYEKYSNINQAITREKQLKSWRRDKKLWLIETKNPAWTDFSKEWGWW